MTDEACESAKLFKGIFAKILDDVFEAYARTPATVSAKPYLERALRLTKAGLAESMAKLERCSEGREKT